MFRWYKNAELCIAYLCDVEPKQASEKELHDALSQSKWFTRGWTLQELLATRRALFVSKDWETVLGHKYDLRRPISSITRIDKGIISGRRGLHDVSIAKRMSWASQRRFTRQEDLAYCLLGLFGVQMPLLYGEGDRAFMRLQLEIIKMSSDESIFAWSYDPRFRLSGKIAGRLLAPCPAAFRHSGAVSVYDFDVKRLPYAMTNRGLQIELLFKEHVFASETITNFFHWELSGSHMVQIVPLNCTFDNELGPILISLCSTGDGGPSLRTPYRLLSDIEKNIPPDSDSMFGKQNINEQPKVPDFADLDLLVSEGESEEKSSSSEE